MNPATKQMIDDVSDLACQGRHVPTAPNDYGLNRGTKDTLKAAASYLNRNKRKIVLGAVALVVAGVLTGGIAVAIAVGAKASGWIGGRIYRRVERWRNEKKVRALFSDLFDPDNGKFKNLDFVVEHSGDVSARGGASAKFKEVFQAVKSLIAHRDFSDMVNTFSNLVDFAKEFHQKYELSRAGINSCEQAIKLLESMYLYCYYLEKLRPAINFFDNYVMFIVLESSRMEAEFGQKFPTVVTKLLQTMDGDAAMALLNKCANSSEVLHTRFFQSEKDYTGWVRAALEPWIKPIRNARSTGTSFGSLQTEASLADKIIAAKSTVPITAVKTGFGQAVSQPLTQGLKAAAVQGVSSNLATSASTAGGEVAAGLVAEIANAAWNSKLYSSGQVLRITGWRDQTLTERIQVVKTSLKPSLDRLTSKFEHWLVSHQAFMDSVAASESLESICAKALRSRKHWAQSVGSDAYKMMAEFHQTVIGMANVEGEKIFGDAKDAEKYESFIKSEGRFAEKSQIVSSANVETCRADEVHDAVDDLLVDKHGTTLDPCSGYCYMPVKFLGKHWADFANKTYATDKADLPIKPIGSTPKAAMI